VKQSRKCDRFEVEDDNHCFHEYNDNLDDNESSGFIQRQCRSLKTEI
jgi:hypothetical protein